MSTETDEGFVIRVDRKARPRYPDYCTAFLCQNEVGPGSYRLDQIRLGLHNDQVTGDYQTILGISLFNELRWGGPIDHCLSLLDGHEIVKLGIEVYRKYFGDKEIILWNGVCGNRDDPSRDLQVPILCGNQSWVSIRWDNVNLQLNSNQYTALFP